MGANSATYQAVLRDAEQYFRTLLASGRAAPAKIAEGRRAWEIMTEQLATSPKTVLAYELRPPDPRTGLRGAYRWASDSRQRAADEISPNLATPEAQQAYLRKRQEYIDLGIAIVRSPVTRQQAIIDREAGKAYLITENPLIHRVVQVVADELMLWFDAHPLSAAFIRQSARAGLVDFLVERPDVLALLRLAQRLPPDLEIGNVPIDRPAVVEAVELAIGLVPYVGSVVAAYEAYTGRDLFGYRLSDVERGVLAATVLLPVAGRLVKAGRVAYTEARLVALYGRDAAGWSRAVTAGGRVAGNGQAARAIGRAETALRVQRSIEAVVAREAADALPKVIRGPGAQIEVVDQAVTDLFRELSGSHKALLTLDAPAIRRIVEKGPNVDHLKGQLLEEVLESQVVPWLRDRAGSFALGLPTGGKKLEFIAGHMIRDAAGRQITDGILVHRNQGVLEIVAVFEAKAGKSAARELSFKSASLSSLSEAERVELRAYAKDVLREERAAARAAGQPFTRTLDDVMKEVALSERGGQVQRDIERLATGAGRPLTQIRIGSELVPVRISPTKTKFFGLIPRDVRAATIERQLQDSGFTYEIIGVDLTQKELTSMAERLQAIAQKMANEPL